ncbi:hypothetical protein [Streptomyces beihaiensis]|uniref:Lipoprotein n=1 Tax=Streptomyces beihaiensis TaxID=2984495 RepID=A0ABT3TRN2_9ACTN|nr:hypothetical protein [Streptomyces beihaiensis]MCX3059704.1 hypothetical protein [Streptomyces beihaiensis]
MPMPTKHRWTATTSVLCGCLLLTVACGAAPLLTSVTAHVGTVLVPSALGVPFGLPGLRATPLGGTTWAWQLTEDFAATVLCAVAVLRVRRHVRLRPDGGRVRRLAAGWTALVAGGAVAGTWRGLVVARMVEAGWGGWCGYAVAGAVFGAVWGVVLGWLPGALTACAPPSGPRRSPHV